MARALPNGKSKGFRPRDFNKRALKRGTAVEMEHTRSRRIAQRIAMDHLVEDPKYYKKLAKIHLDDAGERFGLTVWDSLTVGAAGLGAFLGARRAFAQPWHAGLGALIGGAIAVLGAQGYAAYKRSR